MKKRYVAPALVEYGRFAELTLGSGGTKPDLEQGTGVLINDDCDASGTRVVSCNFVPSN
jgi:hypothetical protein